MKKRKPRRFKGRTYFPFPAPRPGVCEGCHFSRPQQKTCLNFRKGKSVSFVCGYGGNDEVVWQPIPEPVNNKR